VTAWRRGFAYKARGVLRRQKRDEEERGRVGKRAVHHARTLVRALHRTKGRVHPGHGCAPGRWTAEIAAGQLPLPGLRAVEERNDRHHLLPEPKKGRRMHCNFLFILQDHHDRVKKMVKIPLPNSHCEWLISQHNPHVGKKIKNQKPLLNCSF
jgi:hypothetical protein